MLYFFFIFKTVLILQNHCEDGTENSSLPHEKYPVSSMINILHHYGHNLGTNLV